MFDSFFKNIVPKFSGNVTSIVTIIISITCPHKLGTSELVNLQV